MNPVSFIWYLLVAETETFFLTGFKGGASIILTAFSGRCVCYFLFPGTHPLGPKKIPCGPFFLRALAL